MTVNELRMMRLVDAVAALTKWLVSERMSEPEAALSEREAEQLAALYSDWAPGESVEVGDLRSYQGSLVQCVQAHTTQPDWTPDATPALWRTFRNTTGDPSTDTGPDEFVQPVGAHDAYNKGDRVTYQGQVYESLIDANVYSPADYPAGWQLIEP